MSAAPAAHPLAAPALGWLARLPLLGEVELAQLLDAAELEVRMALHSLDRLGWSEWFVPGSPELAASRLAFVRSGATAELRDLLAVADEGLPLPRRDLLARIVRVEATVGINRLLAALAAELRMEASIELAEARALPSRAAAPRRWWPREVDVYGCLRAGALWAPFFVAWDRAAVPRAHRLRRLAAWAEFAATDRCWVPGGMPPVLLVCPDEEAVAEWGDALERRAERAGRVPHAMLAATAASVAEATGDAIWRHTAKLHGGALVEQLEWGSAPPAVTKCGTTTLPELHPIEIRERPLRERAPALATATSASTRSAERLAALALATDAEEKRLLEWIGRHPLLSLGELATLLERPPLTIERRLNWLQRCRLVDVIERCLEGERQPQRRFVITDVALQWLAARDGVPPRRYAKHGIVAARPDGDDATGTRLQGLLRHLDHSVSVNRAFARLAADARRAGLRLATWHNEAESTKRFRVDGRGYWIRPDGAGTLESPAEQFAFLLEYDRGTLSAAELRSKLRGYERYFAVREWEGALEEAPTVLFICTDDRARDRVAAVLAELRAVPALLTSEWRYERDHENSAGLLGDIWADQLDGSMRAWPDRPRTG